MDDRSFLSVAYATRRAVLESLIVPVPGRIMLSERVAIYLSPVPEELDDVNPEAQLRSIFAKLISNYQEGLVLKADQGLYNDRSAQWVKVRFLLRATLHSC